MGTNDSELMDMMINTSVVSSRVLQDQTYENNGKIHSICIQLSNDMKITTGKKEVLTTTKSTKKNNKDKHSSSSPLGDFLNDVSSGSITAEDDDIDSLA